MDGLQAALRPAVLRHEPRRPARDISGGRRPDRRRRLRLLDLERGARAPARGGTAQERHAAIRPRRGAAPAGARRSARSLRPGNLSATAGLPRRYVGDARHNNKTAATATILTNAPWRAP